MDHGNKNGRGNRAWITYPHAVYSTPIIYLFCVSWFCLPFHLSLAGDLADLANDPQVAKQTAQQSDQLPIPSVESRKASAAKVREIFGEDAARATTAEAKAKLSGELVGHAADTADLTDRYVLLEAAIRLGSDGGDVDATFRAIDAMAAKYATDGPATKLAALKSLAAKAPVTGLAKVIDLLLSLAGEQANTGNVSGAEDLAELALSASRRAKDRDRQKSALEQLAGLRDRKKLLAQVQPLIDRLALDSNDREAALDLGKFRCFTEDDWAQGLPLLVQGSDAELGSLAKSDLGNPESPTARLALADKWWAYAVATKGSEASGAATRARFHYGAVLNELSGLEKARIQKKLESLSTNGKQFGSVKRPKGLILWLDASAAGALRTADGSVVDVGKASSGAPVAAWSDIAGGPGVAEQSNPLRMPKIQPKAFGKKPAVLFDGEQWMAVDVPAQGQGTLVLVCRPASIDSHMRIIGCDEIKPGIRVNTRANGAVGLEVVKEGPISDGHGTPPGSLSIGQRLIITATWPAPVVFRMNGKAFDLGRPAKYTGAGGSGFVIGAMAPQGAEPFRGTIAEFRVYDRVFTPQELAGLEGELAGKWSESK
jgi:hypothetical protein